MSRDFYIEETCAQCGFTIKASKRNIRYVCLCGAIAQQGFLTYINKPKRAVNIGAL